MGAVGVIGETEVEDARAVRLGLDVEVAARRVRLVARRGISERNERPVAPAEADCRPFMMLSRSNAKAPP